MSRLTRHADGLWSVAAPLSFWGLQLGTRMTVVRLPDGGLWVHSPIALDGPLKAELDALGPVRHVIAPNAYHHLYAASAAAAWPGATLFAPERLKRRQPNLSAARAIDPVAPPEWGGVLDPVRIEGTIFHETVFVHRPTRTLVTADIVENFDGSPHLPTRLYLRASGLQGRVGFSKFLRRLAFRDRTKARRSIDRLLALDFDRIVLAHGRVLESGGRAALRDAYAWLRE